MQAVIGKNERQHDAAQPTEQWGSDAFHVTNLCTTSCVTPDPYVEVDGMEFELVDEH